MVYFLTAVSSFLSLCRVLPVAVPAAVAAAAILKVSPRAKTGF